MKKQFFTLLMLATIAFGACNSAPKNRENSQEVTEEAAIFDGHTSQNSLDWDGTYIGTLPCADCEGIETTITLSMDHTFTQKQVYLKGEERHAFESEGTFQWDEAGRIITLQFEDNTWMFQVVENAIIHLDMEGNRIEGELAEHYVLEKQME